LTKPSSHRARQRGSQDSENARASREAHRPKRGHQAAGAAAPVSREAARRAAARRRRVLGVLMFTLVVVAVLAWRAVLPWISALAPLVLISAFLVIARLSVRRQHSRRL